MSKLDKNQRIRTSKPRQKFNLSHDYLFTATTGQLRPVSHDLLQPGDRVDCKFNFFLRTMPLSTAAMVDVDFFVDYFFVPLDLLWLSFGAWWSRTKSNWFVSYADAFDVKVLPDLDELPLVDTDAIDTLVNVDDQKFQKLRLLDDLGLSGFAFGDNNGIRPCEVKLSDEDVYYVDYGNNSFFPWQLAAYQCIYQHFYRDDEREAYDPKTFSLNGHTFDVYTDFLKMRYLNRQDDYFTASKLSPLVADINNDPLFLHDFDVNLGNNLFTPLSQADIDGNYYNSSPLGFLNEGTDGQGPDSRAVNQLRALFAQEKLLHVMNMTYKDYDSQVLARLGYDVPKDVKHGIRHLGHDTCQLNIQEIISGSNTFNGESGSALGDLAGQGKAVSKDFEGVKGFVAPCHGVLMTIWTCRTRPKYTSSALRKDMMQDITDFFTPELDDLGMQPLYQYETKLVNLYKKVVSDRYARPLAPNTIIGWAYRYEYLKRNQNRASLAFMRSNDNLRHFTPSEDPVSGDIYAINEGYNTYEQWSSARIPVDLAFLPSASESSLTPQVESDYYTRPHYDLYKVKPNELDNIMLVSWLDRPPLGEDSQPAEDWIDFPWLMYQRDPFIVDGRFECSKVSAMSLYSMPKLI